MAVLFFLGFLVVRCACAPLEQGVSCFSKLASCERDNNYVKFELMHLNQTNIAYRKTLQEDGLVWKYRYQNCSSERLIGSALLTDKETENVETLKVIANLKKQLNGVRIDLKNATEEGVRSAEVVAKLKDEISSLKAAFEDLEDEVEILFKKNKIKTERMRASRRLQKKCRILSSNEKKLRQVCEQRLKEANCELHLNGNQNKAIKPKRKGMARKRVVKNNKF